MWNNIIWACLWWGGVGAKKDTKNGRKLSQYAVVAKMFCMAITFHHQRLYVQFILSIPRRLHLASSYFMRSMNASTRIWCSFMARAQSLQKNLHLIRTHPIHSCWTSVVRRRSESHVVVLPDSLPNNTTSHCHLQSFLVPCHSWTYKLFDQWSSVIGDPLRCLDSLFVWSASSVYLWAWWLWLWYRLDVL